MNKQDHFFVYIFGWIAFCFFLASFDLFNLWFAIALFVGFFLVNPDIDQLFGVSQHRSFITHSILYPIILYWALHPYINMLTAKEFGIILLYPVLVHLITDFRKFWVDLQGSALISFFGKRMTDPQSRGWIAVNIIAIGIYLIYVL